MADQSYLLKQIPFTQKPSPTTLKFTPRRNSSDSMFDKFETELTKITKKLNLIHQIKQQQRDSLPGHSHRSKYRDNFMEKYNSKETSPQSKFDRTQQIQSARDKKFQNTYRVQRERQTMPPSRQQFLKEISRDQTTQSMINMLLKQNQKLARRVGELENLCQGFSHKIGFFKAKYEEQTGRLEKARLQQARQRIKAVRQLDKYQFYCQRLRKRLVENGIDTEDILSQIQELE